MPFDTDWDLDYYKTEYESDEHWQLRRKFMEMHKDKFPEDELVCLAQVFVNVEFMGCKYPDETMRVVGELSQEVAKDFRDARARRLKRTFVKASTAAEARAKDCPSKTARRATDLMSGLPFGCFTLYLTNDRNAINLSGMKSNVPVTENELIDQDGNRKREIYVDGKLAGCGSAPGLKTAKSDAYEMAIEKLQKECFTIKQLETSDRIDVTKNNKTIVCSIKSAEVLPKIDSNNIGYKMMQKLGWSGGGLGSAEHGRENPVDFLIKNNRSGLGVAGDTINKEYFLNMLENYVKSDDIRDLYFDTKFTKEERASLHKIAQGKGLKSVSHGKDPNRFLVIGRKLMPPRKILEQILIFRNPMYLNRFEVTVPASKRNEFPDHIAFKSQ